MNKDSPNSLSIRDSIVEGELEKEATVRDFRTVQTEGNRFNLNIPRYVDTFKEEATTEDFSVVQKLMAELFGMDICTVSSHLKNIFDSGELETDSVIRNFRITASDGKKYNTQLYNLDIIKGYVVDKKRLENGAFLGEMDKLPKGIER